MWSVFSPWKLSSGWPGPDPWGEPHHAEVLGATQHDGSPLGLPWSNNHGQSWGLSIWYCNDRQWFRPAVFRWWMEAHAGSLGEAEPGCTEPALGVYWQQLVGRVVVNIFIIMMWGYLTLDHLVPLTLMLKVTPLWETPTHWLTISEDDMLIPMTSDWAGLLPRLLKSRDDELSSRFWWYYPLFHWIYQFKTKWSENPPSQATSRSCFR